MNALDTEILNLMNKLENKEISWEEYKLQLQKILNSKNNLIKERIEINKYKFSFN